MYIKGMNLLKSLKKEHGISLIMLIITFMIKWLLWQLYTLNSSAAICDVRFACLIAFQSEIKIFYIRSGITFVLLSLSKIYDGCKINWCKDPQMG